MGASTLPAASAGPFPPKYDSLDTELKDVLRRSHVEFVKGWPGRTLTEYLTEDLDKGGFLDVIKAIYERCKFMTGLWGYIQAAVHPWTYAMGHEVSQGFKYICDKPDDLVKLLRSAAGVGKFCEDTYAVHGDKDCFRELITAGPGLHVCVTHLASRPTEEHDIHIDKFQMVCNRDPKTGMCDYKHLAPGSIAHYKDAIPWVLGEAFKKIMEYEAQGGGGGVGF
jgi:hypothetical protein